MPKKPTSPAKINPPEGWKDGEGFGLLWGHDAQGQPVDLVRVADLVRWLEWRDRLPTGGGAKAIDRALPPDAIAWMYWFANAESTGVLVTPDLLHFGQYTSEKAANTAMDRATVVRSVLSMGIDADPSRVVTHRRTLIPAHALRFKVVEPGMPALRALLAQIAVLDSYLLSQVGGVWNRLAVLHRFLCAFSLAKP